MHNVDILQSNKDVFITGSMNRMQLFIKLPHLVNFFELLLCRGGSIVEKINVIILPGGLTMSVDASDSGDDDSDTLSSSSI